MDKQGNKIKNEYPFRVSKNILFSTKNLLHEDGSGTHKLHPWLCAQSPYSRWFQTSQPGLTYLSQWDQKEYIIRSMLVFLRYKQKKHFKDM